MADKMGPLNALTLTSLGTGVLIFTMFSLKTVGGVTAFALFYGFFSGAGVYLIYREITCLTPSKFCLSFHRYW